MVALVANTEFRNATIGLALLLGIVLYWIWGANRPQSTEPEIPSSPNEVYDAFAGGYPVPPMPGQQLPELVGVVAGARAAEETDPVVVDEVIVEGKES